ncbi:uncharacterized protein NEMAJ01_2278 [Nematocida major]|uniref:uncharacterized protein n=1 Tax=Nematocida major TaxID=1912982 RepID=UPI00200736A5|nr:uncharacterized protein NEMAJ01_2278 [Nematocida major]KAH9387382.1 hypothetical protein NEMAJ01_2278 [Nematocida major]
MPTEATLTRTTHVLRLRGGLPRRRVSFTQDTIDNEHMNRKKSKACCIHHSRSECKYAQNE